jgi:hypothetical protein
VQIVVSDLDRASRELAEAHGLTALTGGNHPGRGTANKIVPLGGDYLELITVVDRDEAARNDHSFVLHALDRGWRFAAWALRSDDLEADAALFRDAGVATVGPLDGSRQRPDGSVLRWRSLHPAGRDLAMPFLIEWEVEHGQHPGAQTVEHRAGKVGFSGIDLVSPRPEPVKAVLGDSVAYSVESGPESRIVAVHLTNGTIR